MKISGTSIALFFIGKKDLSAYELSQLRLYVFTVMLTTPLMWSHLATAYFFCSDPFLYQIGLICCLIHFISPFIFRYTGSLSLALNVSIFSGFTYEFAWAHYTGGFHGISPIWFAVLPMVAGLVGSRKDLIIWFIFSLTGATYFFVLYINGIIIPNYLTHTGDMISRILIIIGLIVMNAVYMFVYMMDKDRFIQTIYEKSDQIDNLLTLVGHDISNPLTVISLSQNKLRNLLENDSSEEVQKCLSRIDSCTDAIGSILSQIRDLQSIRRGKVELKFEKVYLNDVVDYLYKVFESKLEAKEITLNYDFQKYQDTYFMGNATALKYQILGNLLSNAIKFSEAGKKITIEVEELSDGVKIHLIDEGVGIESSLLEVLFESNTVPSKIGTKGEKGTGFGMSIVKTFVELSHGSISVESKTKEDSPANHGTHFLLYFKKTLFS